MKFESGHLPEPAAESDNTTTKDKKKNRPTAPAISSESARALSKPAVSLEALVGVELDADKPEKTEKPVSEFAESVLAKSHEVEDEAAENDKTVESLDADERQKVAEAYAAAVVPEVAAEAASMDEGSSEQLEAAADLALLAELRARLADDASPEEALEGAYDAVAQTLENQSETADELSDENEHEEPETARSFTMPTIEAAREDDIDGDADEAAPVASGPSTSPPPPVPPTPTPPSSGGISPSFGAGSPTAESLAYAAPVAAVATERPVIRYNTSQARGLLVGGILGYLIGRRRGRIKTEKRLIPVQKKLEKQVKDLHESIAVKEQQIRTLAHQKTEAETVGRKRQEMVQHLQKEHRTPVIVVSEQTRLTSASEQIAPVLERPLTPVSEHAVEKPAEKVEEMSLAGLLVVAETIVVDKRPLRQMFEAGQLDEPSLRRVVREHMRGGNVHEMVARELVAKELPFETDPVLRPKAGAAVPLAAASAAVAHDADHDRSVLPQPMQATSNSNTLYESTNLPAGSKQEVSSKTAIIVIVGFALALAAAALII